MTGEHEMIGSEASIPVRILVRDDVDVVLSRALHVGPIMGFGHKDDLSDHRDANREEEEMSFVGIERSKHAYFHVANEDSFNGVGVFARSKVEYGRVAFFVYVHLQSLLHLNIASAIING